MFSSAAMISVSNRNVMGFSGKTPHYTAAVLTSQHDCRYGDRRIVGARIYGADDAGDGAMAVGTVGGATRGKWPGGFFGARTVRVLSARTARAGSPSAPAPGRTPSAPVSCGLVSGGRPVASSGVTMRSRGAKGIAHFIVIPSGDMNVWTGTLAAGLLTAAVYYWQRETIEPLRKNVDALRDDFHSLLKTVNALDDKIDRLNRPRTIADDLDDDPSL